MRLGVDIGGTKLLAAAIDDDGQVARVIRCPTGRRAGPDWLVPQIARLANALDARFSHVGVGFPGLVDHRHGVARSSVILDGWHDVPLESLVSDRLGIPCVVDNDVHAHALAEAAARAREGEPVDSMVLVAVGTGIGGALMFGGRLWRGASGVAGEVGHLSIDWRRGPACRCGRRGCLGISASGRAITEAGNNDGRAIEALGAGLASVVNLLNPSLVVLGGGVAERGPGWVELVAARVRAEAFPEAVSACRIEKSLAGYHAGAVGAALFCTEAEG